MDERLDFLLKLRHDLLEQFRGHPNIEAFQRALARQLTEVYEFFLQLNVLRSLQTAEGVQLDGIGDVVVMSRADALTISKIANQNVPMDDPTYRVYLAWKIALNTTDCTHRNVYNALRLFWQNSPLYYSEDVNHPATIFFETPNLSPEDNAALLLTAPKVKPAGVALYVIAKTVTPPIAEYSLRIGGVVFPAVMETTLPQYLPAQSFEEDLHILAVRNSIGETILSQIEAGG